MSNPNTQQVTTAHIARVVGNMFDAVFGVALAASRMDRTSYAGAALANMLDAARGQDVEQLRATREQVEKAIPNLTAGLRSAYLHTEQVETSDAVELAVSAAMDYVHLPLVVVRAWSCLHYWDMKAREVLPLDGRELAFVHERLAACRTLARYVWAVNMQAHEHTIITNTRSAKRAGVNLTDALVGALEAANGNDIQALVRGLGMVWLSVHESTLGISPDA